MKVGVRKFFAELSGLVITMILIWALGYKFPTELGNYAVAYLFILSIGTHLGFFIGYYLPHRKKTLGKYF